MHFQCKHLCDFHWNFIENTNNILAFIYLIHTGNVHLVIVRLLLCHRDTRIINLIVLSTGAGKMLNCKRYELGLYLQICVLVV